MVEFTKVITLSIVKFEHINYKISKKPKVRKVRQNTKIVEKIKEPTRQANLVTEIEIVEEVVLATDL